MQPEEERLSSPRLRREGALIETDEIVVGEYFARSAGEEVSAVLIFKSHGKNIAWNSGLINL